MEVLTAQNNICMDLKESCPCTITASPACAVLLARYSCTLCIQTAHAWTQGWGGLEEASDGGFLEWVGRSQLYSGDVLAPEALQDLTGWMAEAGPGDKRRMMALLRDLHATISPTGCAPALPGCGQKLHAWHQGCPCFVWGFILMSLTPCTCRWHCRPGCFFLSCRRQELVAATPFVCH